MLSAHSFLVKFDTEKTLVLDFFFLGSSFSISPMIWPLHFWVIGQVLWKRQLKPPLELWPAVMRLETSLLCKKFATSSFLEVKLPWFLTTHLGTVIAWNVWQQVAAIKRFSLKTKTLLQPEVGWNCFIFRSLGTPADVSVGLSAPPKACSYNMWVKESPRSTSNSCIILKIVSLHFLLPHKNLPLEYCS